MDLEYNIVEEKRVNGNAVVKVIGVGGGGCNVINNMIRSNLSGVEFIATNTDAQTLAASEAPIKIQLGTDLTKGLGAGADPEVGRRAAEEEKEALQEAIKDAQMLFITAGMGGGTGTGASPVIAEIARDLGILTVGVVTYPFSYEGKRTQIASAGIDELRDWVDSLIVIKNDNLWEALGEDTTVREAFREADGVLTAAVQGIHEVVTSQGLINLDFNDVKNVMRIKGMAMMSTGQESGADRARLAIEKAISNPLLDNISLEGAKGVLVNLTTAPGSLKLSEQKEIMELIRSRIDPEAEMKLGVVEDPNLAEDAMRVTIIATDLSDVSADLRSGSRLHILENEEASTGTYGGSHFSPMIRSGRGGRSGKRITATAEDFRNKEVMNSFQIPAALRKQAD